MSDSNRNIKNMARQEATEATTEHSTVRLEMFSDAVMAVIITILALEIRPPTGAELSDLKPLIPKLLAYVLSFAFVGIYWNNHHHLLRATKRINGSVMWANIHLLFWISLIPLVTTWIGEHPSAKWPACFYGLIGLTSGIAYYILSRTIVRANADRQIAKAIGGDFKGVISVILYAAGAGLAFIQPILAYALYACVSIMWFIPDKRLAEAESEELCVVP